MKKLAFSLLATFVFASASYAWGGVGHTYVAKLAAMRRQRRNYQRGLAALLAGVTGLIARRRGGTFSMVSASVLALT